MELRKIYEYALAREVEGKRFFEENAHRLQHAAAQEAFIRLAGEEQKHIEFIELQIDSLDQDQQSAAGRPGEMQAVEFFSQRAESEALDQRTLEAMVPDLPVLRMAYLIERDFAEFYSQAAQKASGQARQALEMLATWEQGHARLFKEFHDQAFEAYAEMPWGG